jgi:hypothetical protein
MSWSVSSAMCYYCHKSGCFHRHKQLSVPESPSPSTKPNRNTPTIPLVFKQIGPQQEPPRIAVGWPTPNEAPLWFSYFYSSSGFGSEDPFDFVANTQQWLLLSPQPLMN